MQNRVYFRDPIYWKLNYIWPTSTLWTCLSNSLAKLREQNSQLPFLDLQIFRASSGSFSISVYWKPTCTDNYLKFQSNHPKCQRRAIVKSLTDRAKKLCSADNLEGEMKMIYRVDDSEAEWLSSPFHSKFEHSNQQSTLK